MFTYKIDEESVRRFADKFSEDYKKRLRDALPLIRAEWQREFRRQDARMQKVWTPLKTWVDGKTKSKNIAGGIDPRSYAARKKREYYRGKSSGGSVRYLRILKRTGVMLERYISRITISNVDLRVSINYPQGQAGLRARVHSGEYELPKGVLAYRPYDLERFKFVADRIIKREFNKD